MVHNSHHLIVPCQSSAQLSIHTLTHRHTHTQTHIRFTALPAAGLHRKSCLDGTQFSPPHCALSVLCTTLYTHTNTQIHTHIHIYELQHYLQQVCIGNLVWMVHNSHHLIVPCQSSAQLSIHRVLGESSGVTNLARQTDGQTAMVTLPD